MWKIDVWHMPKATNGAQPQKKTLLVRHRFFGSQIRFLIKTSDTTSTGCNRSETITSAIILIVREQDSTAARQDD